MQKKYPLASSYSCFFAAVDRQKFSKDMIARWFVKLVEKDDYAAEEKKGILAFLVDASNGVEDNEKRL